MPLLCDASTLFHYSFKKCGLIEIVAEKNVTPSLLLRQVFAFLKVNKIFTTDPRSPDFSQGYRLKEQTRIFCGKKEATYASSSRSCQVSIKRFGGGPLASAAITWQPNWTYLAHCSNGRLLFLLIYLRYCRQIRHNPFNLTRLRVATNYTGVQLSSGSVTQEARL